MQALFQISAVCQAWRRASKRIFFSRPWDSCTTLCHPLQLFSTVSPNPPFTPSLDGLDAILPIPIHEITHDRFIDAFMPTQRCHAQQSCLLHGLQTCACMPRNQFRHDLTWRGYPCMQAAPCMFVRRMSGKRRRCRGCRRRREGRCCAALCGGKWAATGPWPSSSSFWAASTMSRTPPNSSWPPCSPPGALASCPHSSCTHSARSIAAPILQLPACWI